MLIETVGFISKLPRHLVESFKSTLEEAVRADVILNVCDCASEEADAHLAVTNQLLTELGCGDRPVIPVINKCDLTDGVLQPGTDAGRVFIFAKDGKGLDGLFKAVQDALPQTLKRVSLLLPFSEGGLAHEIRSTGKILEESYMGNGLKA